MIYILNPGDTPDQYVGYILKCLRLVLPEPHSFSVKHLSISSILMTHQEVWKMDGCF